MDAISGEIRWRKSVGEPGCTFHSALAAGPVVEDGRLYVHAFDLVALDGSTGEELWRRPFDGRTRGLATAEGFLVLGTYTLGCAPRPGAPGALHVFDAATGEERWRSEGRHDAFIGIPVVRTLR